MRRAATSAAALLLLSGCGVFRHVNVEPLATAAQRPSNVGAFVAVSDGEQPLTSRCSTRSSSQRARSCCSST
jgi:hypothetical protein